MATVLEIAQLGHPVLRIPAQPIADPQDPEHQHLIEALMHTMVSSAGVGIAAPQVGKTVQLIVVASRPTLRYPHAPTMDPMAILNPQILSRSPELDLEWEGCLSIPGIRGLVVRSRRVVVAYLDRYGQAQEREFTGFPARIVQHEYDHLLGQVFLDRVESTQALISEQEYLKQMTP